MSFGRRQYRQSACFCPATPACRRTRPRSCRSLVRTAALPSKEELIPIVRSRVPAEEVRTLTRGQLAGRILNDVLGYGPLEPLLARDDIADIMVNGANGLHRSRRQDPAHRHPLPRQPAADEHLPAHRQPGRPPRRRILADLRRPPADGSRVNVIAPPLAIDGPRSPSAKFKKDKLTLDQLVKFGSISPEGARNPARSSAAAAATC
jgi:pilus assembly protein CpaF